MNLLYSFRNLAALLAGLALSACVTHPVSKDGRENEKMIAQPFMAQVVGVQWLNPLQRQDYPTEWQLLWTL
ncbi:MAG: virulence factor, partial [Janthinobacterium sp.]